MPVVERLLAAMDRVGLSSLMAEEGVLLPDVITSYSMIRSLADQLELLLGDSLSQAAAAHGRNLLRQARQHMGNALAASLCVDPEEDSESLLESLVSLNWFLISLC